MAVVISGDGGWRDLEKTIAEDLQKDGVAVLGWDSVRYFWHQKTPEQTAADLAEALDTYGTEWRTQIRHTVLTVIGKCRCDLASSDRAEDRRTNRAGPCQLRSSR